MQLAEETHVLVLGAQLFIQRFIPFKLPSIKFMWLVVVPQRNAICVQKLPLFRLHQPPTLDFADPQLLHASRLTLLGSSHLLQIHVAIDVSGRHVGVSAASASVLGAPVAFLPSMQPLAPASGASGNAAVEVRLLERDCPRNV